MAADAGRSLPEHLVVGHLAKAHGTKGELFVWPLTDAPEDVFLEGMELVLGDEDGALDSAADPLVVEQSRPFKRGELVKFEGVDDRNAAELLTGRYVLAAREALAPLEEDEVYYHELLGLTVVTEGGTQVGTVREVYEMEPSDMLEVKSSDGKLHLVPFSARIVRQVDVAGGRIVIDPPQGLLEL
ncbi:MAG TPA: ribosome maturation factor RimM [Longimicrobiales bacterium]|nr:ribosome maturation factor RimM [Longimicrobiales bacterium]